jgi:RNA polymerase sigma-70 factor (ECF subfamily)
VSAHPPDPLPAADQLDRIFRAAWALCGDRERAEDLVQAAYARALLRPAAAAGGDDLRLLLRELRRAAGAMAREERRRGSQPRAPQPLEPEDRSPPPTPAPQQDDRAPGALFAAVAALPDELREVLVAVDIVGLSPAAAGRVLRARERTVIARLDRARRELAGALAAAGG